MASDSATMRLVAGIFELAPHDWAIAHRRRRRTGIVLTTTMALDTLGMLALAAGNLATAIQHGVWNEYWQNAPGALQFLAFIPLIAAILLVPLRPLLGLGDVLRDAATRGDAALAPEAAIQPHPLPSSELPIGGERIGPLRGQRDGLRSFGMGFGAAAAAFGVLLLGGACGVITPWLITNLHTAPPPSAWIATVFVGGTILLGVMALMCAGIAVYCAVWFRRLRHGIFVVADDWGLQWRDTRWRTGAHRLAWHELTSFITVVYAPRGGGYQRLYALNAGEATTLSWTVADSGAKCETLAAERLCRLAATRTSVPLRDLSGPVREAAHVLRVTAKKVPAQADASLPQSFRDALARAAQSRQQVEARLGCVVLIGELVIMLLAYPGAWAAQHYQAHVYEDMLAQVQARPPLFQDTLASDDGQWPLQPGDTGDPSRFTYADGAYQLTSVSGDDVVAWTRATYTSVAVEVTASQQGQTDNDGVGLVLRVSDGAQRMMAFYVSPSGTWSLWRYDESGGVGNWLPLADKIDSDAIHRGAGSQNTMVVIMRGAEYICYINGSFVGVYQDGTLAAGHIGVFVNDGATIGSFTNFAVYSL